MTMATIWQIRGGISGPKISKMAPIFLHNSGILLRDGKIAVNQNCCCSSSSCCNYLNYTSNYYTIRINFSRAWGGTCTDVPLDIPVYGLTGGVNCSFTFFTDLDTSLCDPETSCVSLEVYLTVSTTNNPSSSSSTSCNCDTGENCQLQITGFNAINCDGGIASVELIPPPP